jgi:hypothetical protein
MREEHGRKKSDDTRQAAYGESRTQVHGVSALASILAEAVAEAGHEDVVIDSILKDCLPENLRRHAFVLGLRRGVLEVRTSHGAVAQELSMRAGEIIERINLSRADANRIHSIRIR